ncbi:NACHT domain-containing protein [Streptomyces sp. NPDC013157]|uniref:NACHT domain-containing protein n=1 Tax=Streptomyces sp. NPDC013157 TaxID=3364861 RepID=UPI003684063C
MTWIGGTRRYAGRIGLLLLAAALFGVALYMASLGMEKTTQWLTVSGGVLALVPVVRQPVRTLVGWARHGGTPSRAQLPDAVNLLVRRVREKWIAEEGESRHHDPRAFFPIHWSVTPAAQAVMTWLTWADLLTDAPTPPGQGLDPQAPAGEYEALRETYARRLRHGRLVVLGRGGGGKTHMARRLARDLLEGREPGGPVPVFYSLDSWNPNEEELRSWVTGLLIRDFTWLATPWAEPPEEGLDGLDAPDRNPRALEPLGARLVRDGHLLLVLDGFDEIPEPSRPKALERLVEFGAYAPLVITSRTDEYRQAVDAVGSGLPAAAAVELSPVSGEAVKAYLEYNTAHIPPGRWNAVWDLLDRTRSSPVADVLQVPLMVWLARNVYAPRNSNPAELVIFRHPEAVEKHLLHELVRVAYNRPAPELHSGPWTVPRVRRWLRFLAQWLEREGRRDIEWWTLPSAVTSTTGRLVSGLPVGLAAGVPCGFVITELWGWPAGLSSGAALTVLGCVRAFSPALRPLGERVQGPVLGRACALAVGLATGMPTVVDGELALGVGKGTSTGILAGLAAGFVIHGARTKPTAVKVRIRGHRLNILRRVSAGLLLGLLFGVALGLLLGLVNGPTTGLVFGILSLAMGLALGIVDSLHLWIDNPANLNRSVSPRSVLGSDRAAAAARALVAGPVVAVGAGLTAGVGLGAQTGVLVGALMGFAFMTTDRMVGVTGTCWGAFVLTRAWLAVSRQVPWHFMGFLDDAHHRGLLRRNGPVHQFRHIRLQKQLAEGVANARPLTP